MEPHITEPEDSTGKVLGVTSDQEKYAGLFAMFESFDPGFAIITP